jgi:peptidoglycan hydrolase-like protein with peptidoglycan-binding domain
MVSKYTMGCFTLSMECTRICLYGAVTYEVIKAKFSWKRPKPDGLSGSKTKNQKPILLNKTHFFSGDFSYIFSFWAVLNPPIKICDYDLGPYGRIASNN